MAARPYWKGQIRLALVSIPVEVYSATKSGATIAFNQIHEPSGQRIKYEKVVPGIGPVDVDEIVKGFEYSKGEYVLLDEKEIEGVKLESKKTLELTQFVDAQDIVTTAPAGQWLEALPQAMAEKIDVALTRNVIAAGDFDHAASMVADLSKKNTDAGLAVANDFLVAWGERHDPNIPEPLRKKFALPEDAHIAVTPVMMAKNIDNLAKVMALFRQAGVQWKDNARLVAAFDAAYGNAEAYQLADIEKVFGSVPQMSEGLVLQMMNRMRDSLATRWRKMDVQKDNLTHRTEAQTLQMVRDGYTAALQIADAWLAKNPDGYRVWTVAGTMLTALKGKPVKGFPAPSRGIAYGRGAG